MTRRVAAGGAIGLVLGLSWAAWAYFVPMYRGAVGPFEWMTLALTCPVAFASMQLQFPLRLVWALAINTATFAVIVGATEMLRRRLAHTG